MGTIDGGVSESVGGMAGLLGGGGASGASGSVVAPLPGGFVDDEEPLAMPGHSVDAEPPHT
jgi:hypothetical protein